MKFSKIAGMATIIAAFAVGAANAQMSADVGYGPLKGSAQSNTVKADKIDQKIRANDNQNMAEGGGTATQYVGQVGGQNINAGKIKQDIEANRNTNVAKGGGSTATQKIGVVGQ